MICSSVCSFQDLLYFGQIAVFDLGDFEKTSPSAQSVRFACKEVVFLTLKLDTQI